MSSETAVALGPSNGHSAETGNQKLLGRMGFVAAQDSSVRMAQESLVQLLNLPSPWPQARSFPLSLLLSDPVSS